uniref:Secreted protein n=1 Tax=Anopheles darlingi TaxID=43151 RepID=A0A2M4DIU0_ANODA
MTVCVCVCLCVCVSVCVCALSSKFDDDPDHRKTRNRTVRFDLEGDIGGRGHFTTSPSTLAYLLPLAALAMSSSLFCSVLLRCCSSTTTI